MSHGIKNKIKLGANYQDVWTWFYWENEIFLWMDSGKSVQPFLLNPHDLFVYLPMVTSDELCVSRNLLMCNQTLGIQSIILFRSLFLILVRTSASTNFRRKNLPRNPLTGSIWLAQSTHLINQNILYNSMQRHFMYFLCK